MSISVKSLAMNVLRAQKTVPNAVPTGVSRGGIWDSRPGPHTALPERTNREWMRASLSENPLSMARHPGANKPEELAPCGSPYCAGCYEVEPGVRIHPPRCGEDYGKWLKNWPPQGKVQ
jgi:hypothetical protein